MNENTDNLIPIVPVEYFWHTQDKPFCWIDPHCPCHEDQENIAQVSEWVTNGLLTTEEATDFVAGKGI